LKKVDKYYQDRYHSKEKNNSMKKIGELTLGVHGAMISRIDGN